VDMLHPTLTACILPMPAADHVALQSAPSTRPSANHAARPSTASFAPPLGSGYPARCMFHGVECGSTYWRSALGRSWSPTISLTRWHGCFARPSALDASNTSLTIDCAFFTHVAAHNLNRGMQVSACSRDLMFARRVHPMTTATLSKTMRITTKRRSAISK
jgi:hypothetical protein